MAPFDVVASLGKLMGYLVFLLIGVGFGATLEMSGFGDSRKLAAQFYLKDMTVLKVMFTGIIVAMTLIFTFSSFEILDFNRLYVNPTYLFPGIIGGLIMGVGFIVGGFCPGTSIVALATFKIDGFFFAIGVAFGVFVFGETVSIFQGFHNSSYLGRFTLPELFGLSTGTMVFLVILMALVMFYWAEIAESIFGKKIPWKEIKKIPGQGTGNNKKVIASGVLVFIALMLIFSGQPTPEDKWDWIKDQEMEKLNNREIYIHPGELLGIMNDTLLYTRILDVRKETDFNLFHLENAKRITSQHIYDATFIKDLYNMPDNTIIVITSNNDADATKFYKLLKAQGILNLYILSGGINHWLSLFPLEPHIASPKLQPIDVEPATAATDNESLNYIFTQAVGSTHSASNPVNDDEEILKKLEGTFKKKVKIQKKTLISGGCG
jgi:rhodanese-related sulfurtransferase